MFTDILKPGSAEELTSTVLTEISYITGVKYIFTIYTLFRVTDTNRRRYMMILLPEAGTSVRDK